MGCAAALPGSPEWLKPACGKADARDEILPVPTKTLLDKIWEAHVVAQEPDSPAVLYIDLHLVHEVTSPQAFTGLRQRGLKVRRPGRTVATIDHSVPTGDPSLSITDAQAAAQIRQMEANAAEFGIPLHGLDSPARGIVHVIGPELGLTQPGMTIVCGDSHTATHGAFGALAFGIGTSEVEHVLATQCLLQSEAKDLCRARGRETRPRRDRQGHHPGADRQDRGGRRDGACLRVHRTGRPRSWTWKQRMTVCNMSIEGGARAGMIAPDETTFQYLAGREFAPRGAAWEAAVARWKSLPSDEGAVYDASVSLDAAALEPMITYGTNPGMGMPVTDRLPDPDGAGDEARKSALDKALRYMDLRPASRCSATRSTWSSSAAAPTGASLTCAWLPPFSPGARLPRGCACWSSPARSRSSAKRKPRAWIRCSWKPGPSGASRAVRCASP